MTRADVHGDIDVGIAIIHTRALRARVRRSMRMARRMLPAAGLALLIVALWSIAHPWLQGHATLSLVLGQTTAMVRINDRWIDASTPIRLPAGRQRVHILAPGYYPWEGTVDLTAGVTTTLALPPALRQAQHVQRLPQPASGARWESITTAGAMGWRVRARSSNGETSTSHTIQIDPNRVTRMLALDAVPAGDALMTPAGEAWVEWTAPRPDSVQGALRLALPGQPVISRSMERINQIVWRPDGHVALLVQPRGSVQGLLAWALPHRPSPGPVIATLGGVVQGIHWHPQHRAAVVMSARPDSNPAVCEALLLIWANDPTMLDRPLATLLTPPARCSGGFAPLVWGELGLWWVGHGTSAGDAVLEYWSLESGTPTTMETLADPPVAMRSAPDGGIWMLHVERNGALVAVAWPKRHGRVVLDDVPTLNPQAIGMWDDRLLVIRSDDVTMWMIRFPDEEAP